MAVKTMLPSTNLTWDDIRDTLNANGGSVSNVVASAFQESANINRYSFCKPIQSNELFTVNFTNETYLNSLTPVKYRGGDTPPTDFYYKYNRPTDKFRLGDFRGYIPNEYPVNMSLNGFPDTLAFEASPIRVELNHNNTSRNLLGLLLSNDSSGSIIWDYKFILVINVSNKNRAFALVGSNFSSASLTFYLSSLKELYRILRDAGQEQYSATVFAVGVPQSHPDFNNNLPHEITNNGYEYTCLPASPVCVPNKSFKLLKPKRRCFWSYHFYDSGNNRDLYIPEGTVITAFIKYNDNVIMQIQREEYQGEIEGSGSEENEGTNYIEAQMQIPDVQFLPNPTWIKPEIFSTADRTVYNSGLRTTFLYWDKKAAPESFDMSVGFTYADPNYRPE